MGDTIQEQLDRLLRLFQEEQAANRTHREALNSRNDALSHGKRPEDEGSGPRSGRNGGGAVPRYAKLDFPKYSGLEDPLGWLSRCEHFFTHQQTPDADRVSLAAFHLERAAQLWYLQLLADYLGIEWDDFKSQCNLRFGPPIRSNKLGELAKLKQFGSVADYQIQFELLVSRAGNLTQSQKIQLYISGLRDDIAVEVELHQPADLATARSISRLYEKKWTDSGANDVPPAPGIAAASNKRIKKLTHEEMIDRRRKGLCFNCDEPFTRGHQCPKLFWIEVKDEPPDADPYLQQGT